MQPTTKKSYDDQLTALSAFGSSRTQDQDEWLRAIYEGWVARLQTELDRAWGIYQLFLPLSVASLAGAAITGTEDRRDLTLFAIASLFILGVGEMLVRRVERRERDASRWIRAIHEQIGVGDLRTKNGGLRTKHLRLIFLVIMTIVWGLVIATASGTNTEDHGKPRSDKPPHQQAPASTSD